MRGIAKLNITVNLALTISDDNTSVVKFPQPIFWVMNSSRVYSSFAAT
jgi:hypothetical protein